MSKNKKMFDKLFNEIQNLKETYSTSFPDDLNAYINVKQYKLNKKLTIAMILNMGIIIILTLLLIYVTWIK